MNNLAVRLNKIEYCDRVMGLMAGRSFKKRLANKRSLKLADRNSLKMTLTFTVLTRLVVLSTLSAGCFETSSEEPKSEHHDMERETFDLINEYRKEKGLAELKWNDVIHKQCLGHSQNMASGEVEFSHEGFSDRVEVLKEELGSGAAAENVAYNWGSTDPAQTAVDGWIDSDGHRKNIEGNFDLSAVGIAKSEDGKYYLTQMFLKSK